MDRHTAVWPHDMLTNTNRQHAPQRLITVLMLTLVESNSRLHCILNNFRHKKNRFCYITLTVLCNAPCYCHLQDHPAVQAFNCCPAYRVTLLLGSRYLQCTEKRKGISAHLFIHSSYFVIFIPYNSLHPI